MGTRKLRRVGHPSGLRRAGLESRSRSDRLLQQRRAVARCDGCPRTGDDRQVDRYSVSSTSCSWGTPPVIVTARTPADFSFTMSSWDRGIEPYSFGLPMGSDRSADMVHTVLDRPLFRAGETVSMKHFIRRHVRRASPFLKARPATTTSSFRTVAAASRIQTKCRSSADGIAEQSWKIPADAKLGTYHITALGAWGSAVVAVRRLQGRRVPAAPPCVRRVQGTSGTLVRPLEATLDLHVSYLSGGGASNLPVKVRTVVEPWPLRYPEYENFRFGGGGSEGRAAGSPKARGGTSTARKKNRSSPPKPA